MQWHGTYFASPAVQNVMRAPLGEATARACLARPCRGVRIRWSGRIVNRKAVRSPAALAAKARLRGLVVLVSGAAGSRRIPVLGRHAKAMRMDAACRVGWWTASPARIGRSDRWCLGPPRIPVPAQRPARSGARPMAAASGRRQPALRDRSLLHRRAKCRIVCFHNLRWCGTGIAARKHQSHHPRRRRCGRSAHR